MSVLPGYKGFPITIDYNLTLQEMIEACSFAGDYADFIAKHFQVIGVGVVRQEVVLIKFNARIISRHLAVEGMAAIGLEPAKIEHALALGKEHPQVHQREQPIVFLGSIWESYAPTLGNWTDGRKIRCDCWRAGYYSENHFAAIRKVA